MSGKLTLADKQYLAKILFTTQQLEQKAVADRVGVSENTISKWVNIFNWRALRNRLLVSKETILANLYEEMEELQAEIQSRDKGKRYSNSKEADIKVKLTASIRNLETDLAIADLVESGIRFIKHVQKVGTPQQVNESTELWHSLIQASIKK